jgi:hypothetical protein
MTADITINQIETAATSLNGTENFIVQRVDGVSERCTGAILLAYIKDNLPLTYVPQVVKSSDYTAIMSDAGGSIYHPASDTTARTFTIPANTSVGYPVGATLTFVNDVGAGALTIAIASDTLVSAIDGSTGSRTIAAQGIATAYKMTASRWIIGGTGLS